MICAAFLQKGSLSQYLFPDGKFIGQDAYINFVEQQFQMSVPEFEREVKSDLELQRLQAMVTGGVSVSDSCCACGLSCSQGRR